jgi:hypothetical protein
MAEMVSMKRTLSEMKDGLACEAICDVSTDPYPYGLEIRLDKESMAKLGSQVESLMVGAVVKITAEAKVERMEVSEQSTDKGEESDASATLQIMSLAIDGVMPSNKTVRELRKAVNSK